MYLVLLTAFKRRYRRIVQKKILKHVCLEIYCSRPATTTRKLRIHSSIDSSVHAFSKHAGSFRPSRFLPLVPLAQEGVRRPRSPCECLTLTALDIPNSDARLGSETPRPWRSAPIEKDVVRRAALPHRAPVHGKVLPYAVPQHFF